MNGFVQKEFCNNNSNKRFTVRTYLMGLTNKQYSVGRLRGTPVDWPKQKCQTNARDQTFSGQLHPTRAHKPLWRPHRWLGVYRYPVLSHNALSDLLIRYHSVAVKCVLMSFIFLDKTQNLRVYVRRVGFCVLAYCTYKMYRYFERFVQKYVFSVITLPLSFWFGNWALSFSPSYYRQRGRVACSLLVRAHATLIRVLCYFSWIIRFAQTSDDRANLSAYWMISSVMFNSNPPILFRCFWFVFRVGRFCRFCFDLFRSRTQKFQTFQECKTFLSKCHPGKYHANYLGSQGESQNIHQSPQLRLCFRTQRAVGASNASCCEPSCCLRG